MSELPKTPTRAKYGGDIVESDRSISRLDLGQGPNFGGSSSASDTSYYGKEANTSEYSTNNTVTKDQQVESMVGEAIHREVYMYKPQVPSSPMRNRSPSPTPSQAPRSPMRSTRPSVTSTNMSYIGGPVETFTHLEKDHGIALEDFRTEKSVNLEMLRMARNFNEIAKMYRNAITLMKTGSQGNSNIAIQIQSKAEVQRGEALEARKRLWELHGVTV